MAQTSAHWSLRLLRGMLFGPSGWRNFLLALLALVTLQGFHVLEHAVQNVQVWYQHVLPPLSCGLLGCQLDFPWVHFVYNVAYFVGLGWMVVWAYGLGQSNRWAVGSIIFATAFQGYHTFEHGVQLMQFFATGNPRPPGVIGVFGNNIVIHLIYNLIAWVPVCAALVALALEGPVRRPWVSAMRPKDKGPGKGVAHDRTTKTQEPSRQVRARRRPI